MSDKIVHNLSSVITFRNILIFTVLYEGIHFLDHLIIIFQRIVFGLPSVLSTGILGVFFDRNPAHIIVNILLLWLLAALSFFIMKTKEGWKSTGGKIILFVTGLQSWHMAEHAVQIFRVAYTNCEAPCSGIVDVVLKIDEMWLHLFINGIIFFFLVFAVTALRKQNDIKKFTKLSLF